MRELEARLAAAARRWEDDLRGALIDAQGEARGNELFRQFGHAFPAGYREDFAARAAVPDIEMMAPLTAESPLALTLYRPLEAAPGMLRFKLFHLGAPVTLSDSLPMLERMGLKVIDERPHRIAPRGRARRSGCTTSACSRGAPTPTSRSMRCTPVFEDAFARIFRGEVENDDFNRLVVAARLPAQEIVVLRAYAKYMRQIGFPLSQAFIESTLAAHADIARMLVALFKLRFDPALPDSAQQKAMGKIQQIDDALDRVENLSEDRVLRQYLALILATTRTNFWRRDAEGRPRTFLSFKFDPAKVPGLPEPKPMFEIFVYSTRFEGVHLRGGKVARGGLRWSDRPEDFRTEVLGLVKAQMVKNIVIVPVGSKGGFVLKHAPPSSDRDAFMKEGIACYQDYLRGLLDLTDNRVGEPIVPPPQVKRHDPDDPYLVVAADKGTATFSDYANAISKEYGFWLGDAFASGGSVGYDHKAMGITARGAWESAKRHFREMGVDTQTTDFTRRRHRRHVGRRVRQRHAAVAPHPARRGVRPPPHLPRSQSGPGDELRRARAAVPAAALVVGRLRREADFGRRRHPSRAAPSRSRSRREVKAALAIAADTLTPTELVNAILKAPVDLIYNGGIGTYVKATGETHAQVGDRANDALRVNGRELRCKVFVEGGNLGLHAAGPHRVRAGRRAHLHRCDRQLGGRRHVGPRGQHQDPARPGDRRGRAHREAAQRAARRNDRRRRRAGAARQLLPDAGASRDRPHRAAAARRAGALHAVPGKGGAAQSRDRIPAGRRGDRGAARPRAGPHEPRARGAARLRQDVALRRAAGLAAARRSVGRDRARALFPARAGRDASPPTCRGIR